MNYIIGEKVMSQMVNEVDSNVEVNTPMSDALSSEFNKCDADCSARSQALVLNSSTNLKLTFCNHHFRKFENGLAADGFFKS